MGSRTIWVRSSGPSKFDCLGSFAARAGEDSYRPVEQQPRALLRGGVYAVRIAAIRWRHGWRTPGGTLLGVLRNQAMPTPARIGLTFTSPRRTHDPGILIGSCGGDRQQPAAEQRRLPPESSKPANARPDRHLRAARPNTTPRSFEVTLESGQRHCHCAR